MNRKRPDTGYSQVAEYLLYLFLPKKHRESIPGDLAEEYNSIILPKFGAKRAKRSYWKQVVFSIVPILWSQCRKPITLIATLFGLDSIPGTTEGEAPAVSALASFSRQESRAGVDTTQEFYIDGELEHRVEMKGKHLIVGLNTKVKADLAARVITIFGQVQGRVHVTERIEIRKTGFLEGELITPQIIIEDGAVFRGSIDIIKPPKPSNRLLS